MHIKKLHGVIFAVVAVYLQRKTAWTLEYCRCKQLQYMAVLCNLHFHFYATKSTRGIKVAALKRSTSCDFLAFELKAFSISFNNSFTKNSLNLTNWVQA